jgi:hypothetical protein
LRVANTGDPIYSSAGNDAAWQVRSKNRTPSLASRSPIAGDDIRAIFQ